jgi:site-specific recombinase XerD
MGSTKSETTVESRPKREYSWELESKFLTGPEVKRLRQTCQERVQWAKRQRGATAKSRLFRGSPDLIGAKKIGRKIPVRDWLIIHLALTTGLRVQEIAHLNCGDILLADGHSSVIVRQGKGGKRRLVRFNGELKKHLTDYLEWKQVNKEGIKPEDPLIKSSITGGHLNKRSVQRTFERTSRLAKIDGRHCFHHLRHTYASYLYRASNYNLRLVQKQLGHANIRTTQVYADVFDEDLNQALEKLYI